MDIYVSEGFTEKDACESILKNNIYGLDIDKRAYQLAYFAVLMKARKYNRRILTKGISPLLCSIEETNSISKEFIEELISQDRTIEDSLNYLISSFKNGKEFGSILTIKPIDFEKINNLISKFESNNNLTKLKYLDEINLLKNIINQSILLSKKYDVVVTNPPYMGNNGMNPILKDYIKSNFPLTKTDLFAVFLEKGLEMIKDYGFNCMVTMQSWMFLSSFEKFRKKLIETTTISNLLHMDNMVMRIAFGTSATVFRKINLMNYNSTFYHVKLSDVENDIVNPLFFNDENKHNIKQADFDKIPGGPIAYWVTEEIVHAFTNNKLLHDVSVLKSGRSTNGENNRLFKFWFEIDFTDITFNANNLNEVNSKYIPLNKGGSYRKWYGNKDYVSLIEFASNSELDFKESITWSDINSSNFSARLHESGLISNNVGKRAYFDNDNVLLYNLGYLNTNLCQFLLNLIIPTIHFDIGYVGKIPVVFQDVENVVNLVKSNIEISKYDWDDYELSWDFIKHPFLKFNNNLLNNTFDEWSKIKFNQFNLLKSNEIQLNKSFNEFFNVECLIDVNIDDEKISVNLANYENDVKSFISYAVGCMFGRYSLDNECLQFAGGEFNINNYSKFIPDDDNIIPVLDTAYFDDDIVGYFTKFVEICFGKETLEENLDFIAGALSKSNKPSREKIRDYLLKNFFNDHKKTYKKCPIYWQFSSGKENGFNCLVYMHRYEPSLVARIRTDYLHKTQKAIEQAIANCDNIINHSSSKQEVVKATKDKAKLQKQLKETQEYDEALSHIANRNIEIDLDDGVKVNYAKFQNVQVSKEGKKSKKINLLKKL